MSTLTSDADLDRELAAADAELARMRDAYLKLGDEICALDARAEALRNEQTRRSLAATAEAGPDWPFLLEGRTPDKVRYGECGRQLERLGLDRSGYFLETGQTCIVISLTREGGAAELTAKAAAIRQLLPALIPVPTFNAKVFRIREWGRCAEETYALCVSDAAGASVVRLRYGRPSMLLQDSQLETALAYIQQNLFSSAD